MCYILLYSGLPQIFNLWEEEEVRQAKLACEFHLASHFRRDARVILLWSFVLLYSQKIGGDFTARSLRSRGGEIPAFAPRDSVYGVPANF